MQIITLISLFLIGLLAILFEVQSKTSIEIMLDTNEVLLNGKLRNVEC